MEKNKIFKELIIQNEMRILGGINKISLEKAYLLRRLWLGFVVGTKCMYCNSKFYRFKCIFIQNRKIYLLQSVSGKVANGRKDSP